MNLKKINSRIMVLGVMDVSQKPENHESYCFRDLNPRTSDKNPVKQNNVIYNLEILVAIVSISLPKNKQMP